MIVIPQTLALADRRVYNGSPADAKDLYYIDAAQNYVLSGATWGEPAAMGPTLYIPDDIAGVMVAATHYLVVTVRPGCCGFAWRGRFVRLLLDGDNPASDMKADIYEAGDLGTELNPFQSIIGGDVVAGFPAYAADNGGDLAEALLELQAAPIVGPAPNWYLSPPAVPTEGLIQITPVRSYRVMVLRFIFAGIGIGWLEARPLISTGVLSDMTT